MKQTTEQLVKELRSIADAIEQNDSFQGHIEYSRFEGDLGPDEWEVSGMYRVGNSMGQGGMRIID